MHMGWFGLQCDGTRSIPNHQPAVQPQHSMHRATDDENQCGAVQRCAMQQSAAQQSTAQHRHTCTACMSSRVAGSTSSSQGARRTNGRSSACRHSA